MVSDGHGYGRRGEGMFSRKPRSRNICCDLTDSTCRGGPGIRFGWLAFQLGETITDSQMFVKIRDSDPALYYHSNEIFGNSYITYRRSANTSVYVSYLLIPRFPGRRNHLAFWFLLRLCFSIQVKLKISFTAPLYKSSVRAVPIGSTRTLENCIVLLPYV